MSQPTLCTEAGVTYYSLENTEPEPGDTVVEYFWHHFPSGKEGKRQIAILGSHNIESKLQRLLNYWNRQKDWKYWTSSANNSPNLGRTHPSKHTARNMTPFSPGTK